jgi:hypothetical protein
MNVESFAEITNTRTEFFVILFIVMERIFSTSTAQIVRHFVEMNIQFFPNFFQNVQNYKTLILVEFVLHLFKFVFKVL